MKVDEAIKTMVSNLIKQYIGDPSKQLTEVSEQIVKLCNLPVAQWTIQMLNELFRNSQEKEFQDYLKLLNKIISVARDRSVTNFAKDLGNHLLVDVDLTQKAAKVKRDLWWYLESWKTGQCFNTFKLENKLKTLVSADEQRAALEQMTDEEIFKGFKYDLVVHCDSLIELSKNGWKAFGEREGNINCLRVSVLGNPNVGKSFILANLCDMKLPSGFNVSTKGLSILYSKDQTLPIAYMDTQGMESAIELYDGTNPDEKTLNDENLSRPVRDEPIKEGAETFDETPEANDRSKMIELKITDRRATETLIQQFIIAIADVILIVVDTLKFSDQKLIEKILKANKDVRASTEAQNKSKKNGEKRIFVIHNYSQLSKVNDVEEYITKDVVKSFDVEKRIIPNVKIEEGGNTDLNRRYWVENSDSNVMHFVMARQGTEAGDFFNPPTYQFLLMLMRTMPNRNSFRPLNELKTFWDKNISQFVHPEKTDSKTFISPSLTIQPIEDRTDAFKLSGLKTDFRYRDMSVDIFDTVTTNMMNKDSGITPKICVTDDGTNLVCMVEAPGVSKEILTNSVKARILLQREGYAIHIVGEKPSPCNEEIMQESLQNSIEYGPFDVKTNTISNQKIEIDRSIPPVKKCDDGLVTFRWKKIVPKKSDLDEEEFH